MGLGLSLCLAIVRKQLELGGVSNVAVLNALAQRLSARFGQT